MEAAEKGGNAEGKDSKTDDYMIATEYMVGKAATLPFFENSVLLLIMICYYHSHAIQISKSLISRQSTIQLISLEMRV
jgi:hypothetical protein